MIKSILRLVSMLALGAISSAHAADWVSVGTPQPGITFYYDRQSIVREGAGASMLVLYDFSTPQRDSLVPGPYLSWVAHNYYRCAERMVGHNERVTYYAGNLATGAILFDNKERIERNRPISPDSFNDRLLKAACGY